jgi:hypothetical protein
MFVIVFTEATTGPALSQLNPLHLTIYFLNTFCPVSLVHPVVLTSWIACLLHQLKPPKIMHNMRQNIFDTIHSCIRWNLTYAPLTMIAVLVLKLCQNPLIVALCPYQLVLKIIINLKKRNETPLLFYIRIV